MSVVKQKRTMNDNLAISDISPNKLVWSLLVELLVVFGQRLDTF